MTTATRGSNLPRNLNMGHNKRLSVLTYMVVSLLRNECYFCDSEKQWEKRESIFIFRKKILILISFDNSLNLYLTFIVLNLIVWKL